MSNTQIKIIKGITPNFDSTETINFVEILNKIAEEMGGVPNMGVFADITKVTQLKEMIADVSDSYVTVTTKQMEKPHRDLVATSDITDPYQLELADLFSEKKSSIVKDNMSKPEHEDEDEDDDEEYEDDDDNESFKDMFTNPLKEAGKGFKEVGQIYSKSFKNMTKPFNRNK